MHIFFSKKRGKNTFLTFLMWIFFSQTAIAQDLILVKTKSNALVLQVNEQQEVNTIYFGEKLTTDSEYTAIPEQFIQGEDYTNNYNSIYTPAGSKNLLEPAINVTHADGNTSLILKYVSHKNFQIDNNITQTEVILKDPVYNFEVTLFFKAFFSEDVMEQWTQIENKEKGDVVLHKYASANLYLKGRNDFWLNHYHGDWAKEMKPELSRLSHGIKVLDSKLGTRANLFQPSVFMISLGKPAAEDDGKVIFAGLEWSGNFRTELEIDPLENLRIVSGINNFSSEYSLSKNEVFTTPKFWYILSNEGKGKASRNLHDWARKYKILNGTESRLTLLNNWEATYFDFNESKLKTLIADAKELGVDMFLLDDGWFGNQYPRNNDNAGLGDWQTNKEKLPNGIGTLVETASENGVKFGIWLEPEMVNPDSELYHKHPVWVLKQPKRPEHYFRNQLVLDLSNPEVQDFVYETVDNLFIENPELSYVKWDCNAVIYNAHAKHLEDNQSEIYVEYVKGLYKVLERIRSKYPKIPMMLCSGGGGRVDYGALQYFTEFWPSDNTDPLERIFMQWEYSFFYPAVATANHVTNWGKQAIKYKTDVAMMGKLGFDIVLDELSSEDLKFCQNALKSYQELKSTIWQGSQFRLQDPYKHDAASLMYVDKEKKTAVIFNYLVKQRYGAGTHTPILLKGLNADKTYKIEEINIYPGTQPVLSETEYSGDFLMKVGLNPNVNQTHTSVVLKVTQVD